MLYTKGIEEELFVGDRAGIGKSFSEDVYRHVAGFVRELDGRLTEYSTEPCRSYECILNQMIEARGRLRAFLASRGAESVIPGGTLPLGPEGTTYPTDSGDSYYRYILDHFSTRAVTAGSHLNIGIEEPGLFWRLYRVTRMESPIYIALTAASPFVDGRPTGHRSNRWRRFPQEPFPVPSFEDHRHYIEWTEQRLRSHEMINVRHMWSSVRPNGERRPYDVNRLELRVCDSNPDPAVTIAALALLESRARILATHPKADVRHLSPQHLKPEEIFGNEMAACRDGLDAEIFRWDTQKLCRIRIWLEDLYVDALEEASDPSLSSALRPIQDVLENGSCADRWLSELDRGKSVPQLMQQSVADMEQTEAILARRLGAQRLDGQWLGSTQLGSIRPGSARPSSASSDLSCTHSLEASRV